MCRRTGALVALVVLFFAALLSAAACSSSRDPSSGFGSPPAVDASPVDVTVASDATFTDAATLTSSPADGAVLTSSVTVVPALVTIRVTVDDGVVTANPPQKFQALVEGNPVPATWSVDRGELGSIDATGTFVASTTAIGKATITARVGLRVATASVQVEIAATQNGDPLGADAGVIDAGVGGLGGVGGEPLGAAVEKSIAARLRAESSTAPLTASGTPGFAWLYPYDRTVFPRGLLAPLLQWDAAPEATAVYVKLSEAGYTFEGVYSLVGRSGTAQRRVRIDDTAWRRATHGNAGDSLRVELKLYAATDDKVYGPIAREWLIAPNVLKGTVYYNSYDSTFTGGTSADRGGVLAVKPGATSPVLAVPQLKGRCHVCHSVSADGSTLFVQHENYRDGASYDLRGGGTVIAAYAGTGGDNRFLWSGPYPDGAFALASSGYTREARLAPSTVFDRASGAELQTTGFADKVTRAVTPSFAPDGTKVAFNFWEGPASASPVTPGAGRSLAIADFSCGAPSPGAPCGAPPYAFSNLREVYRDGTRYPAWPAFLPDGKGVVFHNTLRGGSPGGAYTCPATVASSSTLNCVLATWQGAQAELWLARDAQPIAALRLDAANGFDATGATYLPANALHGDDAKLNYQPTVNPVPSGGYYWVVFTSRRRYGNVADGDPFADAAHAAGVLPTKKLWVAAIDINATPGKDPSHPAFYLPGQELGSGNSRGFWSVDPCKAGGTSCETGDECCGGYCLNVDGGLACGDKPTVTGSCAAEFDRCTLDSDCCDPKLHCIAGRCARTTPR